MDSAGAMLHRTRARWTYVRRWRNGSKAGRHFAALLREIDGGQAVPARLKVASTASESSGVVQEKKRPNTTPRLPRTASNSPHVGASARAV